MRKCHQQGVSWHTQLGCLQELHTSVSFGVSLHKTMRKWESAGTLNWVAFRSLLQTAKTCMTRVLRHVHDRPFVQLLCTQTQCAVTDYCSSLVG